MEPKDPFKREKKNVSNISFLDNARKSINTPTPEKENRIRIFDKYQACLGSAILNREYGPLPTAELRPNDFLALLDAIKNSSIDSAELYLCHSDVIKFRGMIRHITISSPVKNTPIDKLGYSNLAKIFITDVDRLNHDEQASFFNTLAKVEENLQEIPQENKEDRVFKLY